MPNYEVSDNRRISIDTETQIDQSININDVLFMFSTQIEDGTMSGLALKCIRQALLNYNSKIEEPVRNNVEIIFRCLLRIQFDTIDYREDRSPILNLIESINFLEKYLELFDDGVINLQKICTESYYKVIIGEFYTHFDRTDLYIPEKFSVEHLLDLDYHLKNISKWRDDKEFDKFIGQLLWRN